MPQDFLPEDTSKTSATDSELITNSRAAVLETDVHETTTIDNMITEAKNRLFQRNVRYALKSFGLFMLISLLPAIPISIIQPRDGFMLWLSPFSMIPIMITIHFVSKRENKQPLPFNIHKMSELAGVKDIDILIGALPLNMSKSDKGALYVNLVHLLENIKANDSYLLTPEIRRKLHQRISVERQGFGLIPESLPLKLAILKALEQVGDKDDLPVVRRLAEMKARTPRQREVRDAAQNCLEYLEIHINDHTEKMSLLRGASPESASTKTLLRPAIINPSTPTDELLRPTDET